MYVVRFRREQEDKKDGKKRKEEQKSAINIQRFDLGEGKSR